MTWGYGRGSLQARLVGVVLVTTLVALIVALGAMRAYHESWVDDMGAQAQLLGQTTATALAFDDSKVATSNLAVLRSRPQVRAAALYDAQGKLFASYTANSGFAMFPAAPGPEGVRIEQRELAVFTRVFESGELVGTVYLRADYELYDRIGSYAVIAAGVLAVAMVVAYLTSMRLQRLVTRPILSIAGVAREVVQQRDYSRRAVKMSDDEVGALVESFNGMMAEIERRAIENETALADVAREVNERRVAQQEIMRLNEQLELRVHDRTAQLEASNRELAHATETAEKANRAKSEFLSSMSHELRTPLNAILGFGQLLSVEGGSLPQTKKAEFTQHILKAGTHLLNLINEILDLAKIESANLMLSLEPVVVADVLEECRSMLEPAARQRGLQMLFPPAHGPSVIADRTRLKQVLLNLLSNAIKYNRENGVVIVDCALAEHDGVRVSVRDTGAGLRPEQVASLFQPFNRLGQETGSVEGSGIGLVVTKRLVELMGGQIGVVTAVGSGCEFWIELKQAHAHAVPVASEAERAVPVSALSPALKKAPLLLYVEDNPANLRLVEEIVAFRGDLRMLSAPDAQLGIELARAHRPEVILMDINLPGLSGTDARAILSADPITEEIPVIAVTANAMPRDRAQSMAAGFFQHVTKPINVALLNAAIDEAMAQGDGPSQH
jgi:signal transduction histidine kinase